MVRSLAAAAALVLSCSLCWAQPKPPVKSAFDKATLEAYLRHQFLLPAQLKVIVGDPKPSEVPGLKVVNITVTDGAAMSQNVEFLVSADGKKLLQGKVFDIAESPFASELQQLQTAGAPSMGPPDAPVTIAVFSDFQCQFCREEAKTLRANLEKVYPTQARLVFKDFPIEQIHPWAKPASLIGRCIHRLNAGAFWEYHDWIFEQQPQMKAEELKAKALDFANSRGVDSLQLTQCIDGRLTEKDVQASSAEARALQVTSTPTLFVNGRRLVGNVSWEQLKQVIDYELDYSKKTQPAKSDACCEVKLPIPTRNP